MGPTSEAASPDTHAAGLLAAATDPLRYDGHTDDPFEVAGVLRSLMPSGVRVLDVGCGTGSVTIIANQHKRNLVKAIEPDEARAAMAVRRGIDASPRLLDRQFLADTGPYDVIMFADVLEHLAAPDEMLKVAIGGLSPGGCILASVPNVAHWSIRAALLAGRFDYTSVGLCDATHLRWFTERSVRDLFERQGLVVEDLRYTAGTSLSVYRNSMFRLVPRRLAPGAIHFATRFMPRLFACQFVLKAVKQYQH